MKIFMIIALLALIIQLISAQKLDKANECKCKLPPNKRIVGGNYVKRNIPWAVSLAVDLTSTGRGIQHFCGGTIINHKWIMTAAHCVYPIIKAKLDKKIRIRVGVTELDDPKIKLNTYLAKRIIYDKRYDSNNASTIADIAMIEVFNFIRFNNRNVQPACVGLEKENYDILHAIGWGSITRLFQSFNDPSKNHRGELPNKLKEAFFDYDESNEKIIHGCDNYLVCLKPRNKGDSVCSGDSGGGLIVTKNGKSKIIGIAQFVTGERGERNGTSGFYFCNGPGAYSRLSWNAKTFKSIVENDFCTV